MSWHDGLSQADKDEMFLDSCDAFSNSFISEKLFRESLAKLGYNAKDIEDLVKEHAPKGSDVEDI